MMPDSSESVQKTAEHEGQREASAPALQDAEASQGAPAAPPSEASQPPPDPKAPLSSKELLTILLLQGTVLLVFIAIADWHGWLHQLPTLRSAIETLLRNNLDFKTFLEAIAAYDFVGVTPESPQPSFYAIMLEVGIWSTFGVLARSIHSLAQSALHKEPISYLEGLIALLGDMLMAFGTAVAVVAFLRTAEFVNFTLKTASIESIIAISFILGFYHDDARKLLGSFKSRITREASETEKPKSAKTVAQDQEGSSTITLSPEDRQALKKIFNLQGEGEGKTL